jgi:hypothetical protein
VKVLEGVEPRLASWDHREHPGQKRLAAFLASICGALAPVLATGRDWAISMTVDVGRPERLYRGHDVENYMTPLVKGLGWTRFVYADVTKRVGGGSRIEIAPALRASGGPAWSSWSGSLSVRIPSTEGKRSIRQSLLKTINQPLAAGPARVQLAWRLPASRNWVDLWKPTGDAMGPVLGEPRFPHHEFHPDDDRVTELALHRVVDDTRAGNAIDVGIWWSLAEK